MDTWALIPVKYLHESKQRLAHLLTIEQRAALIQTCLQRELAVLREVTAVAHTLVISSDAQVLSLAQAYGASTLLESAPTDLNTAVSTAVIAAAEHGATKTLILPADLPFIKTTDIEKMVTAVDTAHIVNGHSKNGHQQAAVTICSDKNGQGTNALLLSPPNGFNFHYGPNSFQQHVAEAQRQQRQLTLVTAPGLQFDLDTEQDWLLYQSLVSKM